MDGRDPVVVGWELVQMKKADGNILAFPEAASAKDAQVEISERVE